MSQKSFRLKILLGIAVFAVAVGSLCAALSHSDAMLLLASLMCGMSLVLVFLLSCVAVLVLKMSISESGWQKRTKMHQADRREMKRWYQRRHHFASRNDILWPSHWYRLRTTLEEETCAEHQRVEIRIAAEKALLETKEEWMRESLKQNISDNQSHADFLLKLWELQGQLALIEEEALDADKTTFLHLARAQGVQLRTEMNPAPSFLEVVQEKGFKIRAEALQEG